MCSATLILGAFFLLVCPAEVVTMRLPGSTVYANIAWPTAPPGCQFFRVPATLTQAQHLHTGGACLMGHGSQQMSVNCILSVNTSVCALVSEGAPTTVVLCS